jgi:exodeoxyribonuclease V alpha subunit
VIPTLEALRQSGFVSPLDDHFARAIARIGGETSEAVILAAALAAGRVGEAHVCLDLAAVAGRSPEAPEADAPLASFSFPALAEWLDLLQRSPLVRGEDTPLVLDGTRLYLRRYYRYETDLARRIAVRASQRCEDVDRDALREALARLFPASGPSPRWQRVAAAVGLLGRFTVIAGGPGTGKTWTAARIVALLVEQGLRRGFRPRIHLLAPTGKAAARLRESIRESRGSLECSEPVRAAIPDEASTIHRALGATPDGRFGYDADRQLVTDAVIVDEASMVDLALMSRLLAAVPEHARVILLGDRDQLASVEAGSVLADICGGEGGERLSRFSKSAASRVRELTGDEVPAAGDSSGIRDCVVHLREGRRFRQAIGTLAVAIQAANVEGALEALRSDSAPEVSLLTPSQSLAARLNPLAVAGYRAYLKERDPEKQLEPFGRFRFLCAHRRGPDGVESVNGLIENALAAARLIRPSEPNYAGRPLLVTRNDLSTRLFNGDIGLIIQSTNTRKALFPGLDSEEASAQATRRISLSRLPAVETAFAITVHKSQGSEFDEVVVVLPEKPSPVLTRELLYTAVTRARERVTVIGTPAIIRHAVEKPTERLSGLRERLWRSG